MPYLEEKARVTHRARTRCQCFQALDKEVHNDSCVNALRKSVGNDIGERAFAEWLAAQATAAPTDRNAERVLDALWPLVERGALKIPRGGYLIKRGRGRIVVEPGGS